MISKEDVADLQPGDVVRVSIEGPIERVSEELRLPTGQTFVWGDGTVASWVADHTLTVVSRAPRRCYVNHDRTQPVPGDVVRDAGTDGPTTWTCHGPGNWTITGKQRAWWGALPDRLRLLVDGTTGQAVTP